MAATPFCQRPSVRERRLLLAACALVSLGACTSGEHDASPAREAPAAVLRPAAAALDTTVHQASLSSASAEADSTVRRARVALHASMPAFREWVDTSGAELSLKDAGEVPFTIRPVIGDFDEDGAPDVIFMGHDGKVEQIVAVLSGKGHPSVLPVTADEEAPPSGPVRRRWMRYTTIQAEPRQPGLEVVARNEEGRFLMPPLTLLLWEGHFVQWFDGD